MVGEQQNKNMISFYAAAIGVMFLLFTASGSAGALLDEQDSGTLDRVLSSRVTMTTLLAGKLAFNTLLAFVQLVVMFLWGWAVFHLDFFTHIPGFIVMGVCTAFAVAAFGILLASLCHSRGQLGAVSTLLILMMSSHRRQHVPALPHAGSDAEGRPVHHQRLGHRRLHQSLLARPAHLCPLAAGLRAARHRHRRSSLLRAAVARRWEFS